MTSAITKKILQRKIMSGSVYCMDKHKAFVEEYSKDKYITLTCHDSGIMRGKVEYINILKMLE